MSGQGTLGALRLPIPSLLYSRPAGRPTPPGDRPSGVLLVDLGDARPGHRSLAIRDGTNEVRLAFPVPTPEIAGGAGEPTEAAPRIWVLHWPIAGASWTRLRATDPEVVVLANARSLFSEGESLVRAVGEVRARLGAEPLLWAPRVALPNRLAALAYLGVDLLDSTEALSRSAEGEFLTTELGPVDRADAAAERACVCPSCSASADPAEGGHAEWLLEREIRLLRAALRAGRLRELVEARLTSEPALAEILRYADGLLGGPIEERAPVTGRGIRNYILKESRRRPEVARFRARFLERYRPPPSKQVLLLVPCSHTKPYRSSPSHRRFLGALEGVANRPRLHVASVTSPLGIVPRELEDVPPARHYDIPVTHEWEEDERVAVLWALRHLLDQGHYANVLVHLDAEEYRFLEALLVGREGVVWTVRDGRTASPSSLGSLREAADSALVPLEGVEGGPLMVVREELAAVAAFQFGAEPARRLFEAPVRLHGRPWFQRVSDPSGTDLATWREERGLFQLTAAGGMRMAPAHPLEVEVRPEVPMQGDLFVPGIERADPAIRTGDAVLLVRAGQLLAVGEAAIPGGLMTELRRGLAVRLRHRVRDSGPPDDRQGLDRAGRPTEGPVV